MAGRSNWNASAAITATMPILASSRTGSGSGARGSRLRCGAGGRALTAGAAPLPAYMADVSGSAALAQSSEPASVSATSVICCSSSTRGREVRKVTTFSVEQIITSPDQPKIDSSRSKQITGWIALVLSPRKQLADGHRRSSRRDDVPGAAAAVQLESTAAHLDVADPGLCLDDEDTAGSDEDVVDVQLGASGPPSVVEDPPSVGRERAEELGGGCATVRAGCGRADTAQHRRRVRLAVHAPRASRLSRHVSPQPLAL